MHPNFPVKTIWKCKCKLCWRMHNAFVERKMKWYSFSFCIFTVQEKKRSLPPLPKINFVISLLGKILISRFIENLFIESFDNIFKNLSHVILYLQNHWFLLWDDNVRIWGVRNPSKCMLSDSKSPCSLLYSDVGYSKFNCSHVVHHFMDRPEYRRVILAIVFA